MFQRTASLTDHIDRLPVLMRSIGLDRTAPENRLSPASSDNRFRQAPIEWPTMIQGLGHWSSKASSSRP